MDHRPQRPIQDRGKSFPGGFFLLRDVHLCGCAGQTSLARRSRLHGEATSPRNVPATELPLYGDRRGGDHDRSLDAVLPAGFHRRKRCDSAPVQNFPARCDHRLHFYRHRRLVHHRCVRRHPVCPRLSQRFRRQRCCPGLASAGRRLCLHTFCHGIVQCLAVRGIDPAAINGLYRVRGFGIRIGRRQRISRSAGVLLAIHHSHRNGSGRHPHPKLAVGQDLNSLPSSERGGAAFCAGLHAAAGQQEGIDGYIRQLTFL